MCREKCENGREKKYNGLELFVCAAPRSVEGPDPPALQRACWTVWCIRVSRLSLCPCWSLRPFCASAQACRPDSGVPAGKAGAAAVWSPFLRFKFKHTFRVQFSHARVFSDSRNVRKRATRIIYLGPLPTAGCARWLRPSTCWSSCRAGLLAAHRFPRTTLLTPTPCPSVPSGGQWALFHTIFPFVLGCAQAAGAPVRVLRWCNMHCGSAPVQRPPAPPSRPRCCISR